MSRVKDLLTAVAADLNTQTWSIPFTVAPSMVWTQYDRAEGSDLRVLSVPLYTDPTDLTRLDRESFAQDGRATVVFEQDVGSDADRVEDIVAAMEAVADRLAGRRVAGYGPPEVGFYAFEPRVLRTTGVFHGYVDATYPVASPLG
ncbi:MAG: hypothetical protein AAF078_01885 [Planctomycetota bacterium]